VKPEALPLDHLKKQTFPEENFHLYVVGLNNLHANILVKLFTLLEK